MPRKRSAKPRRFWEPWRAAKSVTHGEAPIVDGLPEEAARTILEAWGRVDEHADWIVWGSKMSEPGVTRGYLSGKTVVADGERIVSIHRWLGMEKSEPTPEDVSKRIAECVNALAGVADPESFVADIRTLLLHYCTGENVEDPRSDPKVVSLLARCIPIEELEQVCPSSE